MLIQVKNSSICYELSLYLDKKKFWKLLLIIFNATVTL